MNQEEMSMYQVCPYCRENEFRDDDSRSKKWYGSRPYGYGYGYGYAYPSPYWYGGHNGWNGHGYGNNEWHGHGDNEWHGHGGHRDDEENMRHDNTPMPEPCPVPTEPIQPVQPMPIKPILLKSTEKHYHEFHSLEKKVNITLINNTIIEIEKKHPYMMKKLLLLGLAEAECKKIIYLSLLCCGKFDL